MPSEQSVSDLSLGHAVRYRLPLVVALVIAGVLAGWLYAAAQPTLYTSSARVLVNPTSGNPFSPTPASVRQDQETSLETEAQVAGSREVLDAAAETTGLESNALARGLSVTLPPNTQILEIAFTSENRDEAKTTANSIATVYLANRKQRFEEVNTDRVDRVEARTLTVVKDLRAATTNSQRGNAENRAFNKKLADALNNELVSLRAQRTALDSSDTPPGAIISPASQPGTGGSIATIIPPVGGGLAGLVLGCLIALVLERIRGTLRTSQDVEQAGLPVIGVVAPSSTLDRLRRRHDAQALDKSVRRLRPTVLDLEPRPSIIAVSPPGTGTSCAAAAEAVAESFAKAGHRVVLVRGEPDASSGLGAEDGLAAALLHDRLSVLRLLKPSVEPLLSLLPYGRSSEQSRELLIADRLRGVFGDLVAAGHLVVIQGPGIDSTEGEAFVGAADLGLIVVTRGRTRPREVRQVVTQARTRGARLAGLVVDRADLDRVRIAHLESDDDTDDGADIRPGSRSGSTASTGPKGADQRDSSSGFRA